MIGEGRHEAPREVLRTAATASGFEGADSIGDLSGYDNSWDQPGASRLPYTLPGKDWSSLRRRANWRLWQIAAAVL